MEQDEAIIVERWINMTAHLTDRLLPRTKGRLVKSTGDGAVLIFGNAVEAIKLCQALQDEAMGDADRPALSLRIGIALADVVEGPLDVYGHGVNQAARLMQLANPGETLVDEGICGRMTDGVDAAVEDLGACWLRNLSEPIRAFRVGPPGPASKNAARLVDQQNMHPVIAIMPLTPRMAEIKDRVIGTVVADESIRAFAQSHAFDVISGLSCAAVAARDLTTVEIAAALRADYVLSGHFDVIGTTLRVSVELCAANKAEVIWSDAISGDVASLFELDHPLINDVVSRTSLAIISHEIGRAQSMPLPSLKAYTLLLSAVSLLHRLARREFEQAREMLEALVDRSPRHTAAHSWLAYWHSMRVNQGWSDNIEREVFLARAAADRALDLAPSSPLALTTSGMVEGSLLHKLDDAEQLYDAAVANGPGEALAWLLRATLYAFTDRGDLAVHDAERALKLSPRDPRLYLFESIAASACLTANAYDRALDYAMSSARKNALHGSTLRVKLVAEWQLGRTNDAHRTLADLLKVEPSLTVSNYRARAANSGSRIGALIAETMRDAGVPK